MIKYYCGLLIVMITLTSCGKQQNMSTHSNFAENSADHTTGLSKRISVEERSEEEEENVKINTGKYWITEFGFPVNKSLTRGTLLKINNSEASSQEVLPNKTDLEKYSYAAGDPNLYKYYSVFNGVFLTEIDPGSGSGQIGFGCILMDSKNINAQERYVDTGRQMSFYHRRLKNGLIAVKGERYGTIRLLDESGDDAPVQLEFDYGSVKFMHLYDGAVPQYFISFADYFPEQEKYYLIYGENGEAQKYGENILFSPNSESNRPLGVAVLDKTGKLLDRWDLNSIYGYEYINRQDPLGRYNSLLPPVIYDAFTEDGTFLLQIYDKNLDGHDFRYYFLNWKSKNIVETTVGEALQHLKSFDTNWELERGKFYLKADNPFDVTYTKQGTVIYKDKEEIYKLDGDYLLAFLAKDDYLKDTYYLMFKQEHAEPYTSSYIHPINKQ